MNPRKGANQVGVAVGRRPPVLEVSALGLGDLSRDSDGAAAVGDAGGEVVDRRRLVTTGQTTLVVLACGTKVAGLNPARLLSHFNAG